MRGICGSWRQRKGTEPAHMKQTNIAINTHYVTQCHRENTPCSKKKRDRTRKRTHKIERTAPPDRVHEMRSTCDISVETHLSHKAPHMTIQTSRAIPANSNYGLAKANCVPRLRRREWAVTSLRDKNQQWEGGKSRR